MNYVVLFDDSELNGYSALTVEAWIRPDELIVNESPDGHYVNEGGIVHKCGSGDDNFGLTVATGGIAFYIDQGYRRPIIIGLISFCRIHLL